MKPRDLVQVDQLEAEHREAGKAYQIAAADLTKSAIAAGERSLAAGRRLLALLIRIRRDEDL